MTNSSTDTPDSTDREGADEGGTSVPAESTEESQGGTPQTETSEAAQQSLDEAK